ASIMNYNTWIFNHDCYSQNQHIDCSSSMVFDATVNVLLTPLCYGQQVFICSKAIKQDVKRYLDYLDKHGIELIKITPTYLSILLNTITEGNRPTKLKCIIIGGEKANKEELEKFMKLYPSCKILHHYGPTETTVGVTSFQDFNEGTMDGFISVPLGKVAMNTRAYVLDNYGTPVPIGVVGELYIAGAGLARGYLNMEELTRDRFVPNPFATAADIEKGHTRMYRTGDLVRWLPDGNLEFI
ncbi:AMP-binding protein, partial [Croceitalea sp. MTPC5]|uniref:AMP-binding protein n=1 Tax=Croceitalea sp. MTPC5 TaxID=3056565 RepID=UPI0030CD48FA